MALITRNFRQIGDSVIVITQNGIARGTIFSRFIESDDRIKYSIKLGTGKQNTYRFEDEIFDEIKELLDFYQNKFNKS